MAEQETQAASSPVNPLENLTSEQRGKWLETGELPEVLAEKSAPEESATSETPKAAVTPAEESASPPAAEAGKPQETPAEKKGKPGAQERILQLLAKNKELEDRLLRLAKPAEPPKVEATSEATAGKPQTHPQGIPEPTEEDTNPDGSAKYQTYRDFLREHERWSFQVEAAAERERTAQETKKAEREKQSKEMVEGWKQRVAEATKRHPDYAEVALTEDLPIPQGSVPDAYVLESELGAEVLYYLGQHRDELDRISSLKDKWGNPNPIAQVRELAKIEFSLSPNGGTPPAKKVTSAPRPIANLATGSTVPEDEEVAALKEGGESGFLRYQAAANARELKALRGR